MFWMYVNIFLNLILSLWSQRIKNNLPKYQSKSKSNDLWAAEKTIPSALLIGFQIFLIVSICLLKYFILNRLHNCAVYVDLAYFQLNHPNWKLIVVGTNWVFCSAAAFDHLGDQDFNKFHWKIFFGTVWAS